MDTIVIKCNHAETKTLVNGYNAYKRSLPDYRKAQSFSSWVLASALIGSFEAQKHGSAAA